VTSRRLSTPAGARLDRGKAIAFSFNGRSYSGFQGDTLASALLANGVRLVGRSFKLHRPRGIYSCGIEEPTGLVDVLIGDSRTPNVRATVLDIYPGLVAESLNCWPSVGFDVGAINSWFSAVLPAGFYYKTFKWPNWNVFEPSIRAMAGLGRASQGADVDRYEEVASDADVLVVGGGVSGLSAAIAAATVGANVMLLESESYLGSAMGRRSDAHAAALALRARQLGVRVLLRTLAFGVYDHNLVCAREFVRQPYDSPSPSGALRQRTWKIRARSVIAATGSFERPMVFPALLNYTPGRTVGLSVLWQY
jgi:sarcosine oxidase subunit alpha